MSELFELFLRAALVDNLALSFFLGMCFFLGVSSRLDTAFGFGLAVLVVQTLTVPLNHLLHVFLLQPGAWAWLGLPGADLGFLGLATYVGVIAAFVQILELAAGILIAAGLRLETLDLLLDVLQLALGPGG